MAQNHSVTKRNRRQKSHTRGHEGRATQLALRSPEAKVRSAYQEIELEASIRQLAEQAKQRREARDAKRNAMRKS